MASLRIQSIYSRQQIVDADRRVAEVIQALSRSDTPLIDQAAKARDRIDSIRLVLNELRRHEFNALDGTEPQGPIVSRISSDDPPTSFDPAENASLNERDVRHAIATAEEHIANTQPTPIAPLKVLVQAAKEFIFGVIWERRHAVIADMLNVDTSRTNWHEDVIHAVGAAQAGSAESKRRRGRIEELSELLTQKTTHIEQLEKDLQARGDRLCDYDGRISQMQLEMDRSNQTIADLQTSLTLQKNEVERLTALQEAHRRLDDRMHVLEQVAQADATKYRPLAARLFHYAQLIDNYAIDASGADGRVRDFREVAACLREASAAVNRLKAQCDYERERRS